MAVMVQKNEGVKLPEIPKKQTQINTNASFTYFMMGNFLFPCLSARFIMCVGKVNRLNFKSTRVRESKNFHANFLTEF